MRDNSTKLKKKTSDSFGFEWNVFDEIKPEKSFLEYISPIDKSFFKNKLVLVLRCFMWVDVVRMLSNNPKS